MRLSVKNSKDEELTEENGIEVRWREYFVQLLNGEEISEEGVRRARIGGNERMLRMVMREEIMVRQRR